MKLLWWLGLILLVFWALRSKRPAATPRRNAPAADGSGEKMVQCARCEVFVPASEAVSDPSGAMFCCDEHRRKA